jgi:alkanesulfonate monooxygenase
MLVNIVSGKDNLTAYGDSEGDQAHRYARTKEFLRIARKLWTEENVTYHGEHFSVTGSTVAPRPVVRGDRSHPRLYFSGVSPAAEEVAATEADVQLFWGEPLDGVAKRIERLQHLSE